MVCNITNWYNLTSLHVLNGNCNGSNYSGTYYSGTPYHPVTFSIYIVTAVLCVLFSAVAFLKYNSVTVLNVTVRSNVISNNAWIAYFIVMFIRSVVGAGIYSSATQHFRVGLQVYFIADGVLKSFEVFCLLCALNHQWQFRSSGFLMQEIRSLNSGGHSTTSSETGSRTGITTMFSSKKVIILFTVQVLLVILFLTLLEACMCSYLRQLFWTYMALFWTQALLTIIWVILIFWYDDEEGPTLMTKIFLAGGVFITLPADIPSIVWSSCIDDIHRICEPWKYFTSYDLALFLLIPALIIFFLVLRKEYLRLDQEAKYSMLGAEVDSLFSEYSHNSQQS